MLFICKLTRIKLATIHGELEYSNIDEKKMLYSLLKKIIYINQLYKLEISFPISRVKRSCVSFFSFCFLYKLVLFDHLSIDDQS